MDNKRKNTVTGKLHNDNNAASPYRTAKSNSSGLRNGSAAGEKNYGMRPVKKATEQEHKTTLKLSNRVTEADKKRNIERAKKRERLRKQQLRAGLGVAAGIVVAIVLIFMTPLFNIKEIRLEGNDTVPKEIINEKIGDLIGSNLFSTSISNIENKMTELPQIRGIEVKKAIFPARLELNITESQPAGYVLCGSDTLVIDSDLRIIDDASTFDYEKLPSISGISVSDYEMNKQLSIKSEEKEAILRDILKAFEACGLTEMIKYVSIDDITAITFNYDNRIDVLCGSQLQLERKIRMFAESIRTSTFDDNSIGSMDLSVPGTAIYNP